MILIKNATEVRRIIGKPRRATRRFAGPDSDRRRRPTRCPDCEGRRTVLFNAMEEVGSQEFNDCPSCCVTRES